MATSSNYIFFTQVGVSATVLGFCIAMLAKGESASVYLPVLTAITGYWLPSPSMKKELATVAADNAV
jgi:hypothetical protein